MAAIMKVFRKKAELSTLTWIGLAAWMALTVALLVFVFWTCYKGSNLSRRLHHRRSSEVHHGKSRMKASLFEVKEQERRRASLLASIHKLSEKPADSSDDEVTANGGSRDVISQSQPVGRNFPPSSRRFH